MKRSEIEWCLKTQKYEKGTLHCIFKDPNARDGMAITFGFWQGPGEYVAVEFPTKGERYFIHSATFSQLSKTCQECGEGLRDDNNFLKPSTEPDLYICDNCDTYYDSGIHDEPLKRIEKPVKIALSLEHPISYLEAELDSLEEAYKDGGYSEHSMRALETKKAIKILKNYKEK